MSFSYRPPKSDPLVSFSDAIGHFNSEELSDFNRYLNDYNRYVELMLHDIKKDDSKRKRQKEKILHFDYLFSILRVRKDITLNILVVENEPGDIKESLKGLKAHFGGLRYFLIKKGFADFAKEILRGDKQLNDLIETTEGNPFEERLDNFKFDQIDLILQDIFLGQDSLSGAEIADLYFDVAPQAMVFFLTSMDIETLAASGYDNKVDRLVGKERIKGIMKYYYERFHELYGSLLWPVFVNSKDRNRQALITDRVSVRKLLGNIRTWTMAPKILFHGFALPEMVDHEFRHTSGLWKMANDILGPFLERISDAMPYEDRILLSLAIWLHDIGHRGDEYHYEPIEIREHHGSISEILILEHHRSLGIEWLKEFCGREKCRQYHCCCGLTCRNKTSGCFSKELCPLRKLGLICRYHQSTAPLTANKLKTLIPTLKMPSPYCVIGMEDFKSEVIGEHNKQIEQWLNRTKDFGWFGTDIRTLEEFAGKDHLLMITGMLRWLDALHTHSDKVGSLLEIKAFFSYLAMRKKHCDKRINEIDDLLDRTHAGSEAYLNLFAQRMRLDDYSQLLDVQGIHLWRSALVRDIYGEWHWNEIDEEWAYRIIFELQKNDPIEADEELKKEIDLDFIKTKLKGQNYLEQWSDHVWEEVIKSEINAQAEDNKVPFFKQYFKGINTCYIYKDAEGNHMEIGPHK